MNIDVFDVEGKSIFNVHVDINRSVNDTLNIMSSAVGRCF